ncbi:MAG: sporulation protein [Oscillospiraceae bacterium]|nr:sporulation protein [Oscillospiraceae bacterium]
MAKLLERLAAGLDLPAEALAGTPRVTLTGAERVLIENHHGLLHYSDSAVEVGGSGSHVRVRGDGLLLRAMNGEMLLVTGTIFGVDIE